MTFDDIIAAGDLLDGVWDTRRFTRALDTAISAAAEKNRAVARRPGLLFPVASDETACDEHGRPSKRVGPHSDCRASQGKTAPAPVHGGPRIRLVGDASPGQEGVLPEPSTLPAPARRHTLEVPGNV